MPNLPPPICCEVSVGGRIVIVIFLFCLNSHLLKAMAVGSTCWSIISIQTQSYQTWFEEKNDMADQDKSTSSETCLFWNDRNDLLVKLRETFGTCPGFTNTAKAGPAHTCKKLLISHKGNWINTSVSARGASCHHVTPLLSSERPELEPRASKKNYNSREDREFLSLQMTKWKKDKDIPLCWRGKGVWWDSFRSIEDRFPDIGGACHRTTRNVRDLYVMSGGGASGTRAGASQQRNRGYVVTWRAVWEPKQLAL